MMNPRLIALSAALCLPAIACTEPDDDIEIELSQESSDLVVRTCRHASVVTTGEDLMDLFVQTYEVTPTAAVLLTADMTASVGAGSPPGKIIQGLYIDCNGPEKAQIQTTQNIHLGDPALTTSAHLALTAPGVYTCVLRARQTNPGAILNMSSACLHAKATAAQDWPNYPADGSTVGAGLRISKPDSQYVLRHDYDIAASTNKLAIRADLELTNIEGAANGFGEPPPEDPIWRCNDTPFTDNGPATARVRVEATQRAVGGWCGATVKGANVDTVIPAATHHKKIFAGLDLPISRAAGCLPRVNVKIYVAALGTGNDLCLHASRYSNTYVYPM